MRSTYNTLNFLAFNKKLSAARDIIAASSDQETAEYVKEVLDMARMAPMLLNFLRESNEAVSLLAMTDKLTHGSNCSVAQEGFEKQLMTIIENNRRIIDAAESRSGQHSLSPKQVLH